MLAGWGQDAFTKVADIPYLDVAADDYAQKQCRLDLFLPKDKKDFATNAVVPG